MIAKVSLGLNLLLVAAVIYLFVNLNKSPLEVERSETPIAERESPSDSDTSSVNNWDGDLKIAYVLGDSINEKYQYLIDKQDELIRKNRRSEEKITREIESAQTRYMELMQKQQSGGFSSEAEVMAAETELQNMQIRIEELQNTEAEALARNERTMQNDFFDRVQSFLTRYADERGIDMVVNIQMGGSVLYSNKSFDVTSEVLRLMNAEYEREVTTDKN